jgi:imidazolonepropionase-like amidohydrolase
MRRRFTAPAFLAFGLLSAVTAACAGPEPSVSPAASGATGDVVAFVDVNVVPMDGERVLERQTVIVRDGRITEVGPTASVPIPAGATRLEGAGKYLMPGMAEMHAHIPGPQAGEKYMEDVLFLYLANGITTVRGMLGHPSHLVLRERAAKGELWSPHVYTSGPSLNGNSVKSPAGAVRMVTEQKAAGYDLLKIHPGLSREAYDSIDAAADRLGIDFAGHVPEAVGLRRALEARQASVDHLDGYMELLVPEGTPTGGPNSGLFGIVLTPRADPAKIPAIAAATRQAGVWNVPTQSLIENLAGPDDAEAMARRPEMRYVAPQMLAQWVQAKREFQRNPGFSPELGQRFIQIRRDLIRGLHDAGAGLLLGADAPQVFNVPGFAAHHELAMLVASGLTPFQALATGTTNAARYFGAEGEVGTVEAGKRADLLLLDANPLQNIGNVAKRAGVMVAGRWLPESEIQQRLDQIAASAAAPGQ